MVHALFDKTAHAFLIEAMLALFQVKLPTSTALQETKQGLFITVCKSH